jgi:integrase/recombinase XerD
MESETEDKLTQWLHRFRDHMAIRNYSPESIKSYLFYLKRFIVYLKENSITEIAAVTKDTIRDYQTHLYEEINRKGEPNSISHQNHALQAVKTFFRFLREEDYLVADPAREITYAKKPKTLPRSILTESEMKKLLNVPNTKTALGYRDRTILEVLYSAGVRRGELKNLVLQDVDYNEGLLRINSGKGNKDRVVPIGKIACRYLENYIKAVRPSFIRNPYNNHLFLSLRGNRLSHNALADMVKSYARKAQIKKNVSPHTFRHTCATLMLRNKANVRHIQELLGHSSLDTTQIYTSVSIADLKEVHARCHPREKDNE